MPHEVRWADGLTGSLGSEEKVILQPQEVERRAGMVPGPGMAE